MNTIAELNANLLDRIRGLLTGYRTGRDARYLDAIPEALRSLAAPDNPHADADLGDAYAAIWRADLTNVERSRALGILASDVTALDAINGVMHDGGIRYAEIRERMRQTMAGAR